MISPGPALPIKTVMVFIDGGYLRRSVKNQLGHENIDFKQLFSHFRNFAPIPGSRREIIRAFYYDANLELTSENFDEHNKFKKYFENIESVDQYELRMGRIKRGANEKYRQKGVDVLLAVDLITKAFTNQFDVALVIAGDDDMIDAIKAVKNTGKIVCGAYFDDSISPDLKRVFDIRRSITSEEVLGFSIKNS